MSDSIPPPAEALLSNDLEQKETEWQALDDDALLEQIKAYREALTIVSKKMADLGTSPYFEFPAAFPTITFLILTILTLPTYFSPQLQACLFY